MAESFSELSRDSRQAAQALLLRDLVAARLVKQILVTSPSLGAEWTATVPGGVVWNVLGVTATFTASGVVGNRIPKLVYDDGVNVISGVPVSGNATNGFAWQLSWGVGLGTAYVLNIHQVMPLPSPAPSLFAGHRVRTVTASLDAGDQYSAIVLTVVESSEWAVEWFLTAALENLAYRALETQEGG